MSKILETIVDNAISSYTPTDKKIIFKVKVNEITLKKITKELDEYYTNNDNLILSNKGDDWYTFEWECDNRLQDEIYTINIELKENE